MGHLLTWTWLLSTISFSFSSVAVCQSLWGTYLDMAFIDFAYRRRLRGLTVFHLPVPSSQAPADPISPTGYDFGSWRLDGFPPSPPFSGPRGDLRRRAGPPLSALSLECKVVSIDNHRASCCLARCLYLANGFRGPRRRCDGRLTCLGYDRRRAQSTRYLTFRLQIPTLAFAPG